MECCFLVTEAHEWIEQKVMLRPCNGFDLSRLRGPSDYIQASNNAETLHIIEECMTGWIKQIEQVDVHLAR